MIIKLYKLTKYRDNLSLFCSTTTTADMNEKEVTTIPVDGYMVSYKRETTRDLIEKVTLHVLRPNTCS